MKTGLAFSMLGLLCLLGPATSQVPSYLCQLPDIMNPADNVDFPNIEEQAKFSYELIVEYTLPQVKQTDSYSEYYDAILRMGRVDSQQEGESLQYIYRAKTYEAWNIRGRKCQLNNVTETPDFFRNYQTDWRYEPEGQPHRRTMGPSAMFKRAYDVWVKENNVSKTDPFKTMAYLGEMPHSHIRGQDAQVWRWCQSENTSVDFFFAADDATNTYKVKNMPLRVAFNGVRYGDDPKLSEQYYDVILFQPFISVGLTPFEIPIGMGCGRAADLKEKLGEDNEDIPTLPTFSNNMLFYSEVVYRKVTAATQEDLGSYYSNLMFTLDKSLGMVGYFYSPWNTSTVQGDAGKERVQMLNPEYVVYDMTYKYFYKLNYKNFKCEIGRSRSYTPSYKLPLDGGYFDLNSPYVFFPNNELYYLTKSHDRGVETNVFEAVVENYIMNSDTLIPKVIATHTYLRGDDQKTDNVVSVKHTPIQAELRLFRDKPEEEEILTFNFFGFTTKVIGQRSIFDVRRCFKNDDDYSWLVIGFETAEGKISTIKDMDPTDLEYEISKWFDTELDMKPSRVPTILIDLQDELYVSLLILQKPPLELDFTEVEQNKKVVGVEVKMMKFGQCASYCLENESDNCWGFALCEEELCYIGVESKQGIMTETNCTLYRRFSNDTYMKSKESLIGTISEQIQDEAGKTITVQVKDQEVKLKISSIEERSVDGDDSSFKKSGNKYSDRMRLFRMGKKLKNGKVLGKLDFEACQRLCLDYQDCETISFCQLDSRCVISTQYSDDLPETEMETDHLCRIIAKKYADHFEENPGFFLEVDARKTFKVDSAEGCAKSCLKETGFSCRSYDLCMTSDGLSCKLHTTHFLQKETRQESLKAKPTCKHHTRKYSVEFKRHIDTRVKSDQFTTLTNLNVEECAKTCVEFGQGSCYAFDFCASKGSTDSSCIIIDSDPSRLDTVYNPLCTQYLRDFSIEPEYAPRPYTNGYAGGIGFLCFLVGGIIGIVVVFAIAYIRVNRR